MSNHTRKKFTVQAETKKRIFFLSVEDPYIYISKKWQRVEFYSFFLKFGFVFHFYVKVLLFLGCLLFSWKCKHGCADEQIFFLI